MVSKNLIFINYSGEIIDKWINYFLLLSVTGFNNNTKFGTKSAVIENGQIIEYHKFSAKFLYAPYLHALISVFIAWRLE